MSRFRLKLKEGALAPLPYVGVTERPNKEKPIHAKDKKTFETTGKVKKCHAFLEVFKKSPTRTNSFNDAEQNYVVVGRGFAATTNLATLRSTWGKDRIGRRNLILVGQVDPWQVYVQHNMNQEAELLTLPGYLNRSDLPAPGPEQRWLDSRQFATLNGQELDRLRPAVAGQWPGLKEVPASVTWIEKNVSRGKTRFDIHFQDRKTIKATKVDICTGTGQQAYIDAGGSRGIAMPLALWDEYLDPKRVPVGIEKPRIMSAEMYVAGNCQVIPHASVLIVSANSPAGIQAGEHALCLDTGGQGGTPADEVVLVASDTMTGGFLPIGRLDAMARTATTALPVRLDNKAIDSLFPTNDSVWFGENYRVQSIEILTPTHRSVFCHAADESDIDILSVNLKMLVTFKKADRNKNQRIVQGAPLPGAVPVAESTLEYGLFDQVVLSTGRARGGRETAEKEEGSALQLVWGLRGELQAITVKDYAFPVGLQTSDGHLRILGAAGINNPIYKANGKAKNFVNYEKSLPWQARVAGEGVTLAAKTIAVANRYFKVKKADLNVCANTATLDELKLLLGAVIGQAVYDARMWRVRPFQSNLEINRVLECRSNGVENPELLNLTAGLNGAQKQWEDLLNSDDWSDYIEQVSGVSNGWRPEQVDLGAKLRMGYADSIVDKDLRKGNRTEAKQAKP